MVTENNIFPENIKSNTSVTFNEEHNGSSFDKAIIINVTSEKAGIVAEYIWIRLNYPGARIKPQSLQMQNKKSYDVIKIVTAEGKEKNIYFDITNFFEKF